jgi:hypothetical protein
MWNHELGRVVILNNLSKSDVDTDDKVFNLLQHLDALPDEDVYISKVDRSRPEEPIHGILVHYRSDTESPLQMVRSIGWPV